MRRIVVIGAGILGLTIAYRLAGKGEHVLVLEREPIPGGLSAGFEVEPGIWLEKFHHHLFGGDRDAIDLINELGLGDDLIWRRPLTVTLTGGQIHQLDSPASLLRFSPLPIRDRVRMGAALAYLKALASPERFEGQTAAEWIRRRMGRNAYEVVWEPLLRSKFGPVADQIAMSWFWARVHDRTTQLGYLRGGFQRLYDRLAQRITGLGGDVRMGSEVREVHLTPAGAFVIDTDGGSIEADRVVSTLPVPLTCRLVADLPTDYRVRYGRGQALGAHCLVLSLDQAVTDSYWMNINDSGFPFMALVEHTNFMDSDAYAGHHLVYLANYRAMDDPLMTASTDDVVRQFAPHLSRVNPAFGVEWIRNAWSFATPFAQPVVTVAYRKTIPPFETPVPGLWVASMFQVYPHDRGQNYSIELANRLASRL